MKISKSRGQNERRRRLTMLKKKSGEGSAEAGRKIRVDREQQKVQCKLEGKSLPASCSRLPRHDEKIVACLRRAQAKRGYLECGN
jgi:hypothetical protein